MALYLAKYKAGLLEKGKTEMQTSKVRVCILDTRKVRRQDVQIYEAKKMVEVCLPKDVSKVIQVGEKTEKQIEEEQLLANYRAEVRGHVLRCKFIANAMDS